MCKYEKFAYEKYNNYKEEYADHLHLYSKQDD